jgi:hypothetical protein
MRASYYLYKKPKPKTLLPSWIYNWSSNRNKWRFDYEEE